MNLFDKFYEWWDTLTNKVLIYLCIIHDLFTGFFIYYNYRTSQTTTKSKKLDEKLLKSLREDSIDEAVIDEELRALADDDSLRAAGKSWVIFIIPLNQLVCSVPIRHFYCLSFLIHNLSPCRVFWLLFMNPS